MSCGKWKWGNFLPRGVGPLKVGFKARPGNSMPPMVEGSSCWIEDYDLEDDSEEEEVTYRGFLLRKVLPGIHGQDCAGR